MSEHYRGFIVKETGWLPLPDEIVAEMGLKYLNHRLFNAYAVHPDPERNAMFSVKVIAEPDAEKGLLIAKQANARASLKSRVDDYWSERETPSA